jgi:type VI secretion system secreted protein VgrG
LASERTFGGGGGGGPRAPPPVITGIERIGGSTMSVSQQSAYRQSERRLQLRTPLGEDALLLDALRGTEELSGAFQFTLQLVSQYKWVEPASIVGQPVSFGIVSDWPRGESRVTRWFHGIVRRFAHRGRSDRLAKYVAEVVPQAWFLTRRADARIFQERSVPEIVAEVLRGGRVETLDRSGLRSSYAPREYCVQYRETDHDFVNRLLEDEGIFYRYVHAEGSHEIHLADTAEAYPSTGAVLHRRSPLEQHDTGDDILRWEHGFEFRPGRWAQRDYDFKKPSNALETNRHSNTGQPGDDGYEIYGFPGGYSARDEGERRTRARMEAEDCGYDVVHASTVCPHLAPGERFKVGKHPIEAEEGREWVATRVEHVVRSQGEYESGSGSPLPYVNAVTCIPAEVTYRPPRVTPRPVMHGIQTAVVVGPKGEEIYVDEYARIKVQFHWDRYGKRDERSSCWIRVAQPWAGGGYGGLAIPRIGQEVIVEFEEGNPDRPLINGRVYNAEQMPPVSNAGRDAKDGPAPTKMTQAAMMTTIRSQSLGGSGGHNEITMNDTGGKEGLFIRAQKDEIHLIGNDRLRKVGNDETLEVAKNRTRSVGENEKVEVGANQDVKVTGNRSISVSGNETHTVQMCRAQSVMISENYLTGISKTIQTGLAHIETVGMLYVLLVGLKRIGVVGLSDLQIVGGDKTDKTFGDLSVWSGKSTTLKQDKDFIVEAKKNAGVKAAEKIVIEGKDITLKGEGGFIRIASDGIHIKGSKLFLNCSGGSPGTLGDGGGGAASAPGQSGSGEGGSSGSSGGSTSGEAGGQASGAPASGDAGGATQGMTAPSKTGLGDIITDMPGLDSKYGGLLSDLANGKFDVKDLSSLISAVKPLLPEKAQKALDAVNQSLASYNSPPTSPDEIRKKGEKALEDAAKQLKDQLAQQLKEKEEKKKAKKKQKEAEESSTNQASEPDGDDAGDDDSQDDAPDGGQSPANPQ